MTDLGLSRADTVALVEELVDAHSVAVVKGTSRILMAWPFSAIATPFVVHARGKTWFANCAWDAVAFHAMLDEDDVAVDSFCHHCGGRIRIELRGGRATLVEPATTIVYLALRPTEWWEDIITTCSNSMVFFCSPAHRDASGLAAPEDEAASLSPELTHRLSVPLYGSRLAPDYARPSRDELNAHFASLGLAQPYWRI